MIVCAYRGIRRYCTEFVQTVQEVSLLLVKIVRLLYRVLESFLISVWFWYLVRGEERAAWTSVSEWLIEISKTQTIWKNLTNILYIFYIFLYISISGAFWHLYMGLFGTCRSTFWHRWLERFIWILFIKSNILFSFCIQKRNRIKNLVTITFNETIHLFLCNLNCTNWI